MHPTEFKTDFDQIISLADRTEREDAIATNNAFTAAMQRAIKRGREIVRPGIFVDSSPTSARRIRGDLPISPCGSPAAMCADSGYADGVT